MGILFSPYDIHFVPQKPIKGRVIADFLAKYPILENSKLHDIPDEVTEVSVVSKEQTWQLFFDVWQGSPQQEWG